MKYNKREEKSDGATLHWFSRIFRIGVSWTWIFHHEKIL